MALYSPFRFAPVDSTLLVILSLSLMIPSYARVVDSFSALYAVACLYLYVCIYVHRRRRMHRTAGVPIAQAVS